MFLNLQDILKTLSSKVYIPYKPDDDDETPPIYCNADIIKAMKKAWSQTSNGSSDVEAGFRLDGNYTQYKIVPNEFTNQTRKQTLKIIVGTTFAIFHVHPSKNGGNPSTPDNNSEGNKLGDTGIADKYNLDIYVMHKTGLTMYNHKNKQVIKLKNNLDWLKSCDNEG